MNAVEFRFYQGIVDSLDCEWLPEVFYTLSHGEKVPSCQVSEEMMTAMEPFLGGVMSEMNRLRMQDEISAILHSRTMRREILIWTTGDSKPLVIDGASVVHSGQNGYRIAPMLDRTDIMREVMESLGIQFTEQD